MEQNMGLFRGFRSKTRNRLSVSMETVVANFSEREGLFCEAKNVALRRQPTKGLDETIEGD